MNWIYSVTVSVPKPRREEWLQWMQREHIPEVMATGFFEDFHLQELLEPLPFPDKHTFNVQYFCRSREDYDQYVAKAATSLRQKTVVRFGSDIQAVRTLLQRITG